MSRLGISFGGDFTSRWLDARPAAVDCIEIAAEGFFRRSSPYLAWLATRHPLIVHASSLSIGASGPLDPGRLQSLREVSDTANCRVIVHPLGFCASDDVDLGALVPVSLTPASLDLVAGHLMRAIDACGKRALVEPISAELDVPGTLAEPEFLDRLCRRTGCGLFVDIATLLAAGRNLRFDPRSWLLSINPDRIAAVRIGGCAIRNGRWRRDSQVGPAEEAWTLMRELVARARPDVLVLGRHPRQGETDALESDLRRLRQMSELAGIPCESSALTPRTPLDVIESPRRPLTDPPASTRRLVPGPIAIAPDVSLFVLDLEGVFLSESRQEVHLFNTAATLAWCLLEDRRPVEEIVSAYATASGLGQADATAHVAALLHRWFALGYISDPDLPAAPEMSFTTAVAYLLTNAALRRQFRAAPADVTDALRVCAADADGFTRLDPDQLDAQAEAVDRRRPASVTPSVETAAVPSTDRPADRRYRLLTTSFSIRAGSDDVSVQIEEALGHLHDPRHDAAHADVVLDIRAADAAGWVVLDGSRPIASGDRSDQVVPVVKQLVREIAVGRARFFIEIHAGVVAWGDGCVLLPATAGRGKTTLTAGLVQSGATYFSDEVALLDEGTLAARPVPLALTIKDGSVAPLQRRFPELATLRSHVRGDRQRVRYLRPPAEALPVDSRALPIKWIVFPRYDRSAETVLVPLDRPGGLRKLLDESLVLPQRLDRASVESLVMWMRGVECFDLPMSSLDDAIAAVRGLVGAPEEGVSSPIGGPLDRRGVLR